MSLYDKSAFPINNGVVEREDFLAYTSGGNIIDQPDLAQFDTFTKRPFNHVGAHFSEKTYCQPTDDPFTAAKSSTRLIFGFPLTLILSALTLTSFALLQPTTTCAVLTRDSYGNWCV